MVFIVEDGTGLVSTANSYVTIAEIDAYLDRYSISVTPITWVGLSTANKERYAIRCTAILDGMYLQRYKGRKATYEQPLEWPRAEVYDASGQIVRWDIVPTKIKNAVAELCYRISNGTDIRSDVDRGPIKREKIEGLEVEYFAGFSGDTLYQIVDDFLKDYIWSNGRNVHA